MDNDLKAIEDLIGQLRAHYVSQFVEFVDLVRPKHERGGGEMKFEIPGPSSLYKAMSAVDFVGVDHDDVTGKKLTALAFEPDRQLSFPTFGFTIGEMATEVESLRWDNCEIEHDRPDLSPDSFASWFETWFDERDTRYEEGALVCNIIHSLSFTDGIIGVDFGTADAAAFWTLLQTLADAGATKARIYTPSDAE